MSWLDTLEEVRKTDWSAASASERLTKSREVVNICAYGAAAIAVVPVPLADLALLLPVHSMMVMTVGHIHDRRLSRAEAKRVVMELGAIAGVTFAGRAAITALLKLIPGVGSLLSVPATFALTWGLGRVSIEYFRNPSLSRDDLRKVFDEAVQEGKSMFSRDAFDRFRQGNEGAKVETDDPADDRESGAGPGGDNDSSPGTGKKKRPGRPDEKTASPREARAEKDRAEKGPGRAGSNKGESVRPKKRTL